MKKLIISILVVALVLFGASLALRGAAEARAQQEHLWLMQTLVPGAGEFRLVEYTGEDSSIRSIHEADYGYVVEVATYGYAGEITMLVGVNHKGAVTGLVVLEAHETLGLGSRILTDHEFLSQFLNQSGAFSIAASGADAFSGATGETETAGEEITVDGISGATVSSKAVARAVSSAVAYVTGVDAVSSATSWGG